MIYQYILTPTRPPDPARPPTRPAHRPHGRRQLPSYRGRGQPHGHDTMDLYGDDRSLSELNEELNDFLDQDSGFTPGPPDSDSVSKVFVFRAWCFEGRAVYTPGVSPTRRPPVYPVYTLYTPYTLLYTPVPPDTLSPGQPLPPLLHMDGHVGQSAMWGPPCAVMWERPYGKYLCV